jgi:hypothetical protein
MKMMFANRMLTDGSAVNFVFARSAKPATQKVELELSDFSIAEVQQYLSPCAVDPGMYIGIGF